VGWNCYLLPSLDFENLRFDSPRIDDALLAIEGMSISPECLPVDDPRFSRIKFEYRRSAEAMSVTINPNY
jgi:hypothetical protein